MIGGVPHMNRWMNRPTKTVGFSIAYVFVYETYETIHFGRLMTLHHALLQESEIKMNNTPFGQLIIPSQAILCVCLVITRGHLPMEQHWKTRIVSSCLTQKTTQFHQFHHVSKFHHPFFLQLGLSTPRPNDPHRFRPLSQAPALPGEAGDLGFHLADGRAVDLYAHLLLGERLGRYGENWEKKSATRIIGKMFIEKFSATNHENPMFDSLWVMVLKCHDYIWLLPIKPINRRKVIVYSSFYHGYLEIHDFPTSSSSVIIACVDSNMVPLDPVSPRLTKTLPRILILISWFQPARGSCSFSIKLFKASILGCKASSNLSVGKQQTLTIKFQWTNGTAIKNGQKIFKNPKILVL